MGKSSIFLALPTVSPHTYEGHLEHEDNNEAKQDIGNTKNLNPLLDADRGLFLRGFFLILVIFTGA